MIFLANIKSPGATKGPLDIVGEEFDFVHPFKDASEVCKYSL